jgi:hypothetical protein
MIRIVIIIIKQTRPTTKHRHHHHYPRPAVLKNEKEKKHCHGCGLFAQLAGYDTGYTTRYNIVWSSRHHGTTKKRTRHDKHLQRAAPEDRISREIESFGTV